MTLMFTFATFCTHLCLLICEIGSFYHNNITEFQQSKSNNQILADLWIIIWKAWHLLNKYRWFDINLQILVEIKSIQFWLYFFTLSLTQLVGPFIFLSRGAISFSTSDNYRQFFLPFECARPSLGHFFFLQSSSWLRQVTKIGFVLYFS